MPGEHSLLVARNLTKTFGRFTALKSLSLELAPEEFLTIVGRNGAGKTTLLKIVSSIIRTFSGDVTLFGQNLKQADEAARRRIGFVSHESLLYKDLTVRDNLMFYARLYGVSDRDRRIDEMIERVDLEARSSALVRALSRGMKQRLSLARALIHQPTLLLLDEPFTGLDERASEVLDRFLSEHIQSGGAAIMATHDIERGWQHANRVVVLDRGTIVHQTTTEGSSYEAFRNEYRDILYH
ncbi:MAG: heme ABC exporter ATP-binding protein CcmA [Candidatus Latescibacterota bacterium]|nr:MAG: heme ABC exporter ATP-binding protein CcmA [Candidatus Latescibacterota bacterium]